jgi:hypothetical protein
VHEDRLDQKQPNRFQITRQKLVLEELKLVTRDRDGLWLPPDLGPALLNPRATGREPQNGI